MAKTRGFRLGRRLISVFRRCVLRRARRRSAAYLPAKAQAGAFWKVCGWVRSCSSWSRKGDSGYIPVGQEDPVERPRLPKGHLAVYVGEKEGNTCRVIVPVIYFNHPLFGELLREAEKVYGFHHPGGILIPCPKSELESVQMRIAAAGVGRRWGWGWRWRWRWNS
ncbi:auxin-responsive protein SAUR36-like [Andrographis paniculata]|uniref:auxin-responsive protein SAUR36-like n=1 Tax=Andrographis paniculata TaxID=175694 RepID=UPI0021E7E89E|nr:auxin-responsive protein SAUR36-like [Andrographis paniculata]